MVEKVFELKEVSLLQAGKGILLTFGVFAIGLFGSFAYALFIAKSMYGIFFHLRNALILLAIVYGAMQLFKKKKTRDFAHTFSIKILDHILTIEMDQEIVYTGGIHELKAIRTLDLSNRKDDVQGQIYIGNRIYSLTSSLNNRNKNEFNDFVRYCEKLLHLEIKPVPFSVYTHNFQGIKYLEYFNPKNPLIKN